MVTMKFKIGYNFKNNIATNVLKVLCSLESKRSNVGGGRRSGGEALPLLPLVREIDKCAEALAA